MSYLHGARRRTARLSAGLALRVELIKSLAGAAQQMYAETRRRVDHPALARASELQACIDCGAATTAEAPAGVLKKVDTTVCR